MQPGTDLGLPALIETWSDGTKTATALPADALVIVERRQHYEPSAPSAPSDQDDPTVLG